MNKKKKKKCEEVLVKPSKMTKRELEDHYTSKGYYKLFRKSLVITCLVSQKTKVY